MVSIFEFLHISEGFDVRLIDRDTGRYAPKDKEDEVFSFEGMRKVAGYWFDELGSSSPGRFIVDAQFIFKTAVLKLHDSYQVNFDGASGTKIGEYILPLLDILPGKHSEKAQLNPYMYVHVLAPLWGKYDNIRTPKEVKDLVRATISEGVVRHIDRIVKEAIARESEVVLEDSDIARFVAINLASFDLEVPALDTAVVREIMKKYKLDTASYVLAIARENGSGRATKLLRKCQSRQLVEPKQVRELQKSMVEYPRYRSR